MPTWARGRCKMAIVPYVDSMNLPVWDYGELNLFTRCELNGILIPGACTISPIKIINSSKDNKKPGQAGGGVIMEGLIPPKFSFISKIFTQEDYETWRKISDDFLALANPDLLTGIPVYHPLLADLQITACIVLEIEIIPPQTGGFLGIEIHCVAVNPGQPAQSKLITKGKPGSAPPKAGTKSKAPVKKPAGPSATAGISLQSLNAALNAP
jgi:hypothetical protein